MDKEPDPGQMKCERCQGVMCEEGIIVRDGLVKSKT